MKKHLFLLVFILFLQGCLTPYTFTSQIKHNPNTKFTLSQIEEKLKKFDKEVKKPNKHITIIKYPDHLTSYFFKDNFLYGYAKNDFAKELQIERDLNLITEEDYGYFKQLIAIYELQRELQRQAQEEAMAMRLLMGMQMQYLDQESSQPQQIYQPVNYIPQISQGQSTKTRSSGSSFGKFNPSNPFSEYNRIDGKYNPNNPFSEYNRLGGSLNLNNPFSETNRIGGSLNPNNSLSEVSSPFGRLNPNNPFSEVSSPFGEFNPDNPFSEGIDPYHYQKYYLEDDE